MAGVVGTGVTAVATQWFTAKSARELARQQATDAAKEEQRRWQRDQRCALYVDLLIESIEKHKQFNDATEPGPNQPQTFGQFQVDAAVTSPSWVRLAARSAAYASDPIKTANMEYERAIRSAAAVPVIKGSPAWIAVAQPLALASLNLQTQIRQELGIAD